MPKCVGFFDNLFLGLRRLLFGAFFDVKLVGQGFDGLTKLLARLFGISLDLSIPASGPGSGRSGLGAAMACFLHFLDVGFHRFDRPRRCRGDLAA